MKQFLSFPMIFLLLVLIAAAALNLAAGSEVVDIDGNKLKPGSPYYIGSLQNANAGFLLYSRNGTICPLVVTQKIFKPDLPVKFTPLAVGATTIVLESENLLVEFLDGPYTPKSKCNLSLVWSVDRFSEEGIVTTGGKPSSRNSWFRIERKGGHSFAYYKLVYSPTTTDEIRCGSECKDLGIETIDGIRYLGFAGEQLWVYFVKVIDPEFGGESDPVVVGVATE